MNIVNRATNATDASFSCSGYGLWILTEGSTTGATALFYVKYTSDDGVKIISDPDNIISSYYTINKPSSGTAFELVNTYARRTTLTNISF